VAETSIDVENARRAAASLTRGAGAMSTRGAETSSGEESTFSTGVTVRLRRRSRPKGAKEPRGGRATVYCRRPVGDLRTGSIGRGSTTWRLLIWPVVALVLSAALLACSDNELVVVGPDPDAREPTVDAFSTPPSTDAPGSTTTTTAATSTTTAPPTGGSGDGDGGGGGDGPAPGGGGGGGGGTPTPTSPPATVSPPPAGAEAVADPGAADRSLTFVNQHRTSNARGVLASDPDLNQAALDWAQQLAASGNLSHNPDLRGVVPDKYGYIGENVAYSWTDANIDQGWWESQGHHDNILGEHYTAVGIAFVVDDEGTYWAVQVFGG